MKITKYGLPQAAVFPAILALAILIVCLFLHGLLLIIPVAVLGLLFIWTLSFFRDPIRKIVNDESILLSPCDGTVTEIENTGGGTKVSVFLSLFSVHINRVPCSAEISEIRYKKGEYRDARDPESAQVNESNDVIMTRLFEPFDGITVRQVSGAVARHIVCAAKPHDRLSQGSRFGMIKFGSRTELILDTKSAHSVCVKVGDKVRAGITPIIKYGERLSHE